MAIIAPLVMSEASASCSVTGECLSTHPVRVCKLAAQINLARDAILLGDCAYDSDALRQSTAERGAWANVKPLPRRVNIPAFSHFLYRFRNLVERFFNKLKHFRVIATRFEKHDATYLALIKLAAARIWMRFMSR
jgi:transposase